jgi:ABC-type sugar transport system permease subunit
MMELLGAIFPVLLLALFVLVVLGLALYYSFTRQLRMKYPKEWAGLGSPTLLLNNSISNSLRTWRYIDRGNYRALKDDELSDLAMWLRVLKYVYFAVLAATVIARIALGR